MFAFRERLYAHPVFVFVFILPWRWWQKWLKHFGEYSVMKQFQNIVLHVLVLILYSNYNNVFKTRPKTEIRSSPWSCAQEERPRLGRIASDKAEPRLFGTQRIETELQLWNYSEQYPTLGLSFNNNEKNTFGNKDATKNPQFSCTAFAFGCVLLKN